MKAGDFGYMENYLSSELYMTHFSLYGAQLIKSRIAMAKAAFSKKKTLFTSKLDLNLRKKLIKCYIWSMALYGAETWTLRAADQKYLESFEMLCWRRMEKISWTYHVRIFLIVYLISNQKTFYLHAFYRVMCGLDCQWARRGSIDTSLVHSVKGPTAL